MQAETKKKFEASVLAALGEGVWGTARGYGASNRLMFLEAGIEYGTFDLVGFSSGSDRFDGLVLFTLLSAPAGFSALLAICLLNRNDVCGRTLREAAATGEIERAMDVATSDLSFSCRNNNVSIWVGEAGRVEVRNKGHWVNDPDSEDWPLQSLQLNAAFCRQVGAANAFGYASVKTACSYLRNLLSPTTRLTEI